MKKNKIKQGGWYKKKKNTVIQGRWYKINKKVKKRIKADYHKIKDWVMDPKGYFLIAIDREKKLLRINI